MINTVLLLVKIVLCTVPFLLLVWLSSKANLKQESRHRQSLMPLFATVYCLVAAIILGKINAWVVRIIEHFSDMLTSFIDWLGGVWDGNLADIATVLGKLRDQIEQFVNGVNIPLWAGILANALIILGYVVLKAFVARIGSLFLKDGSRLHDRLASLAYYRDEQKKQWFVKPQFMQGITMLKALYITSLVLAVVGIGITAFLVRKGLLASLYYPVFGVIMLGELYFFLNGAVQEREKDRLEGEKEISDRVSDYTLMRKILRRTFGDKLLCENTTVNNEMASFRTNDEVLSQLEADDDPMVEGYGHYMRRKVANGLDLDQNYLMSGLDLLKGKSILFNNPFYNDLIPYIFYPMNRTILRRKKVLVVLGRHAIEDSIMDWCRKGLASVNHVPTLWNVDVLSDQEQDLDVGIITRSDVHNLKLHDANEQFFSEVEFVVLVEPSKLVATAQIGLNSLVKHCRRDGKPLVFCSTDKNCDGIVDSLSHILMTSLEEVAATKRHNGTSSYMCWEVDDEHLQHRLLPNLSRYLGVGTELSFAALKNQVASTGWYGGDAFPVLDMHWIAKQYHYDLLTYAALPAQQSVMDEVFHASSNLWDAQMRRRNYLTVEDESYNMFEIKREFSTRASEQGFVNVISSDYMLKDYMAANESIFNADAKAIPYIVADYANTERNIMYRLCLRMSAYKVSAQEIRKELAVADISGEDLQQTLFECLCNCSRGAAEPVAEDSLLHLVKKGKEYTFTADVIRHKRQYSFKTGKMEDMYFIDDQTFVEVFLGDLHNAEYISEDENGEKQYLGTELRGHVFQKYLPGQFFTFGGKYYEMVRLSTEGKVVVRRAADHINGRPQYRQERKYTLHAAVDSGKIGDDKDIGGIRVVRQYVDLTVDTPAYWQMKRYHDFSTGKRISINAVPTREYRNKAVLKIDFGQIPKATLDTLALMMNEVFRTLYAENQHMICAVTAGDARLPLTYSIHGDDSCAVSESSIYIIEDSQLDIGLLISVERNLYRIFNIICDYLGWHFEALEESLNPPQSQTDTPATPDLTLPEQPEKPAKGIKKFFGGIAGFFRRLFKRKPKAEREAEKEAKRQEKAAKKAEKEAAKAAKKAEKEAAKEAKHQAKEAKKAGLQPETEEPSADMPAEETAEDIQQISPEDEVADETSDEVAEESAEETEDEMPVMLCSLAVDAPEETGEESEVPEETEEVPQANVEFDPDGSVTVGGAPKQKPYHQRCYMHYGFGETPENLDLQGTLELLIGLGYGNSFLEQARKGKNEAELIEKNYIPNRNGVSYCDFCGVELTGAEYEVLSDGRERCVTCGRTAVRTEEEFRKIYETVIRNMRTFYGITIQAPIHLRMVNAKKLHKHIGKSFVPTGAADGRVLGVAIKDKNGYTILLENGSPRISATMTLTHELTHIWQYLNWDAKKINRLYGKEQRLLVYEGMAKWAEIQYAYLINETASAKREEIITRMRQDEYGIGFQAYDSVYPISAATVLRADTPFDHPDAPLGSAEN